MERREMRDDITIAVTCTPAVAVAHGGSSPLSSIYRSLSYLSIAVLTSVRTASLVAMLAIPACVSSQKLAEKTFPFEFEDARLFVPVTLADLATHWLIIDTGASPTILDANLAEALRLRVTLAGSTTGAGTNSLRIGRAHDVSLRVGGVALGPMDVTVSEIDSLLAPSEGRHASGIIGSRLFLEHVVELRECPTGGAGAYR